MICRERGAVVRPFPWWARRARPGCLRAPASRAPGSWPSAHVSNVLGTINPVTDMTRQAHEAGALSVSMAPRRPPIPSRRRAIGCDFYVLSAHKIAGPTESASCAAGRELLERLEPGLGGSEMIKEVWIDHAAVERLPWRFEPGTRPARRRSVSTRRGVPGQARGWRGGGSRARSLPSRHGRPRAHSASPCHGPRNAELKGAVAPSTWRDHPHEPGAALCSTSGGSACGGASLRAAAHAAARHRGHPAGQLLVYNTAARCAPERSRPVASRRPLISAGASMTGRESSRGCARSSRSSSPRGRHPSWRLGRSR